MDCVSHIMHSNATHLPVPFYPSSTLVTSLPAPQKPNQPTNQQNKTKHPNIKRQRKKISNLKLCEEKNHSIVVT